MADGSTIDAAFINADLRRIDFTENDTTYYDLSTPTTNKDPEGSKLIRSPLRNGIYYIGDAANSPDPIHTYPTLAECATEFTQIGVTKSTEIIVLNSVSDTAVAEFGPSPYGDTIQYTMRPYNSNVTLTNTKSDAASAIMRLNGVQNFKVTATDTNSNSYSITFAKTGRGNVITGSGAINFTLEKSTFKGSEKASDVLSFSNVQGGILQNNTFANGNYSISLSNNSSNLSIQDNVFGGGDDRDTASATGNGIALLGGTNNVQVLRNNFAGIRGTATSVSAVKIAGNSSKQQLNINIYNNIIQDMVSSAANSSVSVFEISNCSAINVYYNTVVINSASTEQMHTAIFNQLTANSTLINSKNNLFSITASTQNYVEAVKVPSVPNATSIFNESDYNFYNGISIFYYDGQQRGIDQWITATGKDSHSSLSTLYPNALVTADGHIDGDIVGQVETLVPLITGNSDYDVLYDIDGIERGLDATYPGYTTVGHDEAMLNIRIIDSLADVPAQIIHCEDAQKPIMIGVEKRFRGWLDEAVRTYSPAAINIWVTNTGDTLTEVNGYRTDYFPYLYIEKPTYEQSCTTKVITNIGYYASESSWCNLAIIKLPEFLLVPEDTYACSDASEVSLTSDVYGSYVGLQWEKNVGGTWVALSGNTGEQLDLTYTSDPAGLASVEGTYRLRVDPYPDQCGAAAHYYSSSATIKVGTPLTAVELATSEPEAKLLEGVCMNESLWFSATVPEGAGTVMGYQWEKYDVNKREFVALPSEVYETADDSVYVINSVRLEDAGRYRCRVIGVSSCITGSYILTDDFDVVVNKTSAIVMQPTDVISCVGNQLTEELSATVTQSDDAIYPNKYQWFRDGDIYIRKNSQGEDVTDPSIDGYDQLRTDSTCLPFEELQYNDGGSYKMRMIYVNCIGEVDTVFSKEVNLFVYDQAKVIHQTQKLYAMRGGFAELNITVTFPGSTSDVPMLYQWCRNVNGTITELRDNNRISGTQSDKMIISPVQDGDINSQTYTDYYFCVVTGYCGDTLRSDSVSVYFVPEITISRQPSNAEECEDGVATFSVTASPSEVGEDVAYQWYKDGVALSNGGNISGADTNTLTIDPVSVSDAGLYKCFVSYVSNGAGTYTTEGELKVEQRPEITGFAGITGDTLVVKKGDNFTLTATYIDYSNGLCSFQWSFKGMDIDGAVDYFYGKTDMQEEYEGWYILTMTSLNECGEAKDSVYVKYDGVGISEQSDPHFRIVDIRPNPVADNALLTYILPESSSVKFSLLDVSGSSVMDLYTGYGNEGENSLNLSGRFNDLSSGTYFILLESLGRRTMHKMTLTR
jgi:hypothetical protein